MTSGIAGIAGVLPGSGPETTAALLYADSNRSAAPPDSDLQAALDELAAAYPAYAKAEQYFEGQYGEYFASIRVRRAMARTGANFRLNFARGPVRAVADRLEIASITTTNTDANKIIQDMWEDNELDLELPDILEKASEFGDAYVTVWPSEPLDDHDDDYRPTGVDTFQGENTPTLVDTDDDGIPNVDIFYNNPLSVRIFYDPEKPRVKAFAIKRWMLSNTKQIRVDLYYPDRIERYITKPGILEPKATELHPFTGDGQDATIDNPFGEIPIFHLRTARPYGRPEHIDFYGAQDAIHKLIVSHMSGVDYHSLPQRYALGDDTTDSSEAVNSDEDEFAFGLDTGATSRPGDPQSQLSAEPGSLWWLQRVKAVGQFAEADPKTFLDPLTVYLRAGAQISETPMRLMDPSGDPPSGESRRLEEAPFTKKIERRQTSYGATLRQIFTFALKIIGLDPATGVNRFDGVKVQVQWKSADIVDDLQGWQTVVQKLQAGLPVKQAFKEAGYTDEQVTEWFGDEGDDMPQRVDLLTKIAGALQAFSAAAATGMFAENEIRLVITSILGEVGISTTPEENPDGPNWTPPAGTQARPQADPVVSAAEQQPAEAA